ncbi:hypothetical protein KIN20_012412 [Parelaphostrongylus tenuis]|uniref:Uncharacterized protein n=1 Tax=Parelaphostrongylus tenuis TaxID=148309 RepID=A0AAD5MUQ5_PARTN|nr:hypothetical protein KIN20_012412 [Parelaphostrongylus tenuis]
MEDNTSDDSEMKNPPNTPVQTVKPKRPARPIKGNKKNRKVSPRTARLMKEQFANMNHLSVLRW